MLYLHCIIQIPLASFTSPSKKYVAILLPSPKKSGLFTFVKFVIDATASASLDNITSDFILLTNSVWHSAKVFPLNFALFGATISLLEFF